jgi:hypothetical protein
MTEVVCLYCQEPVLETDRQETTTIARKDGASEVQTVHYECLARSILGSVAHQQKRCSCYGGDGGDDEFPTGRIAAMATLAYFQASEKNHEKQ